MTLGTTRRAKQDQNHKKKTKIEQIRSQRDPSKVVDVLDLKIKYCKEQELKSRSEYKREEP